MIPLKGKDYQTGKKYKLQLYAIYNDANRT